MAYATVADLTDRIQTLATDFDDITLINALDVAWARIAACISRSYSLPVSVAATATLTAASNPSDTETVILGSRTYTFKATPAAAWDVDIGADKETSMLNLLGAIMQSGDYGDYYTGATANTAAWGSLSGAVITLTARKAGPAGNYITLDASGCSGITEVAFSGGLREYPLLVQLNCDMAAVSLLQGQADSNLSGSNAALVDKLKEDVQALIGAGEPGPLCEGAIALIDTTGTARSVSSSMTPVTEPDGSYPIADMGDPTTWSHDSNRDWDRS